MAVTWQETQSGFHDGYSAWEAAQPGVGTVVPYFLKLTASNDGLSMGAFHQQIKAFLTRLSLSITRQERDRLITEVQFTTGTPALRPVIHLVAYGPRGVVADDPGSAATPKRPAVTVLHIGPPLAPDAPLIPETEGENLALPMGSPRNPMPMAAVIDDGIPFLHARFRKTPVKTRFLKVWLQGDARLGNAPAHPEVTLGRVVTAQDINAHLALGEDESDVYRETNRALLRIQHHQSTNHRISHGAHVLDVMAGADCADTSDPMLKVPLLAVQLPPAAVIDTSGRRLESDVAQGLRWLVTETLRATRNKGATDLVVNISLGSLAGPGDETAFLARWLDHETARYAALSGGAQMHVTVAYGNAHRLRLVARQQISTTRPLALDWCVLPDDHSPSFLEVRLPHAAAGAVSVTLTPPDPALPAQTFGLNARKAWHLADGPAPVAGVYVRTEDDCTLMLIALAPTERQSAGPVAASGRWKIAVTSTDTAAHLVTLRVQRDDTPAGYRILGRQSWLDHPTAWEWDAQTRDWVRPAEFATANADFCPISRQGTAVAFAGCQSPTVYFVGSIKPMVGMAPGDLISSLYSAEGAAPGGPLSRSTETAGPTLAAMADDGAHMVGRRAAGVLSRAQVRLSGTSVAAPSVARAILLHKGADNDPLAPLIQPMQPAEPTGSDAAARVLRLTGRGVLKGQAPYEHGATLKPPQAPALS